jgi:hypothetical protein
VSSLIDESSPTQRRVFVVGIAVVALLVGLLLGRAISPDSDSGDEAAPSTNPTPDEAQTEQGAVEAATRAAQVMAGFSGDPSAYLEEARSIAAPSWKTRAEELAQGAIDFIQERYGSDSRVNFQPIRYRVASFSEEEAVIDIWGVVLATGPKISGLEESWITGTIELTWTDTGWRVSGQSSQGGPTPELLRTEEEATLSEILSDFSEYEDATDS